VQTLTEIVAAVVVHSSAAAYSHFGVTLDAHQTAPPAPAERTVARTAAPKKILKMSAPTDAKVSAPGEKADDCPQAKAHVVKA
jgi:hypothetical protein